MKKNLHKVCVRPIAGLMVLGSVAVAGCVDSGYDLDNLSKGVGIGADGIVIPFGHIDNKTLDDLIGDDIEGLTPDGDGNYSYVARSGDDKSTVEIDPFEVSPLNVSVDNKSIVIDYPAVVNPEFEPIDLKPLTVATNLTGTSLQQGGTLPIANFNGKAYCNYAIDPMPSMISRIETLYLGDGDDASSDKGAKLTAKLSLNGLKSICSGGEMELTMKFPDGYTLKDEKGSVLSSSTFKQKKSFAAGADEVSFTVYLHSLDLSGYDLSDGLVLKNDIEYSFDFTLNYTAGTAGAAEPSFTIQSNPVYVDADIRTASTRTAIAEKGGSTADLGYTFSGLENVDYVEAVHFADGQTVKLTFNGGANFPAAISKYLTAEIAFPEHYIFKGASQGCTVSRNVLTADFLTLASGVELLLDRVDCSKFAIENGTMTIDGAVTSTIYVPGNTSLKLSDVKPADTNQPVNINIDVKASNIETSSVDGRFSFSESISHSVDLGDLGDSGLDIANVGISPIIEFSVVNPVGVKLMADIKLTPRDASGETYSAERVVEIKGVEIAGNALSEIVISSADRRDMFAGKTFCAAEIGKLLEGEIPSTVDLEAVIYAAPEVGRIELSHDTKSVEYDYTVTIPLEFAGKSQAVYRVDIEDISENIDSELDDIQIKEVVVVGDFASTIPLDLTISAVPYGKDGKVLSSSELDMSLVDGYRTIYASPDGKSAKNSTILIRLNIPSGDLSTLRKLDKMTLKFEIANSSDSKVTLNESHSISALLTLRINGGIIFDLDNL